MSALTDAVAAMHEAERAADAAIVAAFDQAAKVRRHQRRLDRLRADSAEKRRAFEDARDAVVRAAENGA